MSNLWPAIRAVQGTGITMLALEDTFREAERVFMRWNYINHLLQDYFPEGWGDAEVVA